MVQGRMMWCVVIAVHGSREDDNEAAIFNVKLAKYQT
jgi:hypothetical protein